MIGTPSYFAALRRTHVVQVHECVKEKKDLECWWFLESFPHSVSTPLVNSSADQLQVRTSFDIRHGTIYFGKYMTEHVLCLSVHFMIFVNTDRASNHLPHMFRSKLTHCSIFGDSKNGSKWLSIAVVVVLIRSWLLHFDCCGTRRGLELPLKPHDENVYWIKNQSEFVGLKKFQEPLGTDARRSALCRELHILQTLQSWHWCLTRFVSLKWENKANGIDVDIATPSEASFNMILKRIVQEELAREWKHWLSGKRWSRQFSVLKSECQSDVQIVITVVVGFVEVAMLDTYDLKWPFTSPMKDTEHPLTIF